MESNDSRESLRSLRFLHQLLMLVTAGIFVLALTGDPSRAYDDALKEVSALKKIAGQNADYGVYLSTHVLPAQPSPPAFVLDMVREAGVRIPKHVAFPKVLASDWMFVAPNIAAYDEFFSSRDHMVAAMEPHFEPILRTDWMSMIKEMRQRIAAQDPQDTAVMLQRFQISVGSTLPDGTLMLYSRDAAFRNNLNNNWFTLGLAGAHNPQFSTQGVLATTFSLGAAQTGPFALDWLQTTQLGNELIDPKSKVVFPKLKKLAVWNRVRLMEIDKATEYLTDKLDHIDAETISFFGLSVPKNVALWAGPLASVLIGWFFLLHLMEYDVGDLANPDIRKFPWVGVFPGWTSWITIQLTLVLFPFVANILLLRMYGGGSPTSARVGTVLTALLLPTLLVIAIKVEDFRQRVHSPL